MTCYHVNEANDSEKAHRNRVRAGVGGSVGHGKCRGREGSIRSVPTPRGLG